MYKKMFTLLIAVGVVAVLWSMWGFFGSRVEQADYVVVKKMSDYEIREYPARIVAQASVQGPYGRSLNDGFGIVAEYIFGGNTKKESIAMTAPVFVQAGDAKVNSEKIAMTAPVLLEEGDGVQTISFGMPRSYTLETLPTPNDPRVSIVKVPTKKYAATRFSWYRSDARIERVKSKLLASLVRDGVTTVGATAYAGYNAPGTPPWMLRNEVLVEIAY